MIWLFNPITTLKTLRINPLYKPWHINQPPRGQASIITSKFPTNDNKIDLLIVTYPAVWPNFQILSYSTRPWGPPFGAQEGGGPPSPYSRAMLDLFLSHPMYDFLVFKVSGAFLSYFFESNNIFKPYLFGVDSFPYLCTNSALEHKPF